MKNVDLIDLLSKWPENAEVRIWDMETGKYQPVSGLVFTSAETCEGEELGIIELQCD